METLLALASRNLKESQWETVLPEVLHSIRSLLCTATNATPYERLFSYQQRTPSSHSLPTWFSTPARNSLQSGDVVDDNIQKDL